MLVPFTVHVHLMFTSTDPAITRGFPADPDGDDGYLLAGQVGARNERTYRDGLNIRNKTR